MQDCPATASKHVAHIVRLKLTRRAINTCLFFPKSTFVLVFLKTLIIEYSLSSSSTLHYNQQLVLPMIAQIKSQYKYKIVEKVKQII